MQKLTARQRQVLEIISAYIRDHSFPPTIREVQKQLGLRSTKGVKDHIDRLVDKGYLRRTDGAARAIELVSSRRTPPAVGVPVIGLVAAGLPLLADENIQEVLPLPERMVRSDGMFLLRVVGDSMTGAAILDGDLVLVRPQPFVEQGEIAVALLDDEATVKRFFRSGDRVELRSENPDYPPILCGGSGPRLRILGKVTAVYRTIE